MTDDRRHEILDVEVSEERPPEAVPVGVLRSGLESEDNIVRAHAASVASNLPEASFGTLYALVPTLVDRLEDERRTVVFHTTIALSLVAEDRPDRLEPAVPGLVSLLSDDLALVRSAAARALGLIAEAHPSFLTDQAGALLTAAGREPEDVLDPASIERAEFEYDRGAKYRAVNREARLQQTRTRKLAANLLVEVADHDPSAVRPHLPALLDLLADEDDTVVTACAVVVGLLAASGHEAAAAVDPLLDLLDRRDDDVLASAVAALGYVGEPAAAGPLRDLAADRERDGDLRALAEETADYLEGR